MSAAAIERLHGRVLAALETHYGAASQTATQDEAAFDEATYMRAMTVADRVRDWLSGQGAGAKKWLLEMWADWLPRVVVLGESEADRAQAQALADELKGQWAGRGLKTVLQQQNLMTDTRNLLKALDPQHPALRAVSFSTAEYVAKTAKTQDGLEERLGQTVLLSHEQVEALTRRAVWLLGRTHWAEIAAGLVAVTGRRSSEILATATFEPVSRWSVSFSGQLKRRGVLAGRASRSRPWPRPPSSPWPSAEYAPR